MRIRRATAADAEHVIALEDEGFGVEAWSAMLVVEAVTGSLPTIHVMVAVDDLRHPDVLVGCAVVSVVDGVAELQRIVVTAALRRTGVASRLLAESLDLAARVGAERMLLEVREGNDGARAFYAARGFTELSRRRRYYNDGATAIVCELALVSRAAGGEGTMSS